MEKKNISKRFSKAFIHKTEEKALIFFINKNYWNLFSRFLFTFLPFKYLVRFTSSRIWSSVSLLVYLDGWTSGEGRWISTIMSKYFINIFIFWYIRVIHLKNITNFCFYLPWAHEHVQHYLVQAQPIPCYDLHLPAL